MTRVLFGEDSQPRQIITEPEESAKCELCGVEEELRPYGPNRERICFRCMLKNQETAKAIFRKDVLGIE
jgi:hypothetical protein